MSLEHIDVFCKRLFGAEADPASPKCCLFKTLLLYVRSYYYTQEERCTFTSAFDLISLAFRKRDGQCYSVLDLMIMGRSDMTDLESLRDAGFRFKGEQLDLAIKAMVEYGVFAHLGRMSQERIALQLIHEICSLAVDKEQLELIAADMKTAVEKKWEVVSGKGGVADV